MGESEFVKYVGIADSFALLSAAFSYPDEALVSALENSYFVSDLRDSLSDAQMSRELVETCAQSVAASVGEVPEDRLFPSLKAEYTGLFYGPGKLRKIYPYESAFIKKQLNPEGEPAAFITRQTHDVEAFMARAHALPEDARTEPADFIGTELDFLRHLFTGLAEAHVHDDEDESVWKAEIAAFMERHALNWMPAFFEKTIACTEHGFYQSMARCALLVLDFVGTDCGLEISPTS